MKKTVLVCMMIAGLAGCSWRDRDRGYESSGSSTPPAQAQVNTPTSQEKMDWSNCEQHPYTPGPKACK
ncbi:MAG TPA: hypothetical protein VF502_02745 [Stellaceae bacterium]